MAALTIRQNVAPTAQSSESLTLELLKVEQTIRLEFTGLRQLRLADLHLADLHPGSLCFLDISSVARDQMEGIYYRVFNAERFPIRK